MKKSQLKNHWNKASTIIKIMKETKDRILLQVSIRKRECPMPSTKEMLLDFINEQRSFNDEQRSFNSRIESKVDANSKMIKQAHPELFNES